MRILKLLINFIMDSLETIAFIGSIYIVVIIYLAAPTQVQGASMEPTFHSGDRVIISKVSYKLHLPQRGDVIVFRSLRNPDIDFFKRVIGLPGDEIMVKNGVVFVNDKALDEPYTSSPTNLWDYGLMKEGQIVTVPEGKLFVLGDNRIRSDDSRDFGFIPISNIVGKEIFRYFSHFDFGFMRISNNN